MDEILDGAAARGAVSGPRAILPLNLVAVSYVVGGKTLLDRIDLQLDSGARTLVMGPNGAGKSLLMRVCHGLIRPTSGRVVAAGRRTHAQAMVFQRPVLLRRTALANVEFALKHAGTPARDRRRLALAALQQAGLAAIAQRQARVLSGGEQQKLALARAWALRPQVLFLDEPTASLDPAATAAVEALINEIHAAGTKIVMSSHDLGQARRLADEVLFLHRGRLMECTPAGEFFAGPRSEAARAFVQGRLYWE